MYIGACMLSKYEGGMLRVSVDGYGGKDASIPLGDPQFPVGFLARPLDPELDADRSPIAGSSCQAAYTFKNGQLFAVPTIDLRQLLGLPELEKGESLHYGGPAGSVRYVHVGAGGVTLGKIDGAIPVALATPLTQYLTALEALITSIAGIVDLKLLPMLPSSAAALVTSFEASTAALKTAMAATLAKAV